MSFTFRPYSPDDRAACVALFAANTPHWFAAHEQEQYESFLDEAPAQYFVMPEENGAIAGAGGIEPETARGVGWLTWGMVDSTRHGQGLGKTLPEYRLELLRANLRVNRVCIDSAGTPRHSTKNTASPHSASSPTATPWAFTGTRWDRPNCPTVRRDKPACGRG